MAEPVAFCSEVLVVRAVLEGKITAVRSRCPEQATQDDKCRFHAPHRSES